MPWLKNLKNKKYPIWRLDTFFSNTKYSNLEIINDLIIAAYNNAKDNLKKKSAEELSKVTGGLNLPLDFKLPF